MLTGILPTPSRDQPDHHTLELIQKNPWDNATGILNNNSVLKESFSLSFGVIFCSTNSGAFIMKWYAHCCFYACWNTFQTYCSFVLFNNALDKP